ncbi:MAG: DNA internalization-related competence protein ComEC/Rec2 [Oscillospiraceae bacterium]|nr:DNA internalization-related competence protein ComEC/Rec2 [Oscillospiraceae bacterium]
MRKLAIFAAGFALAAACYVYLHLDARAFWIAGACVALSLLCRVFTVRRVSIACLGLAVGLLWCCLYQQLWLQDAFAMNETEQTVQVRVSQYPRQTTRGASVLCTLNGHGAVLYGKEELLPLTPGDFVTCRAKVKVQTDDLYLMANDNLLMLYAKSELTIEKGDPTWAEQIRIFLQSRIHTLYEGEAAGLVKALLTGDRSGLSYQTTNAMSVAGVSHAVAVSGMHVSILITMIAMLCGYSPKLTALFGIPIVVSFALMTGASPSVCRAAVMQILLLCAPLARRERDNATTLGAAALLILAQNPWCIASVSFQLSFAAVAGLMLFCERIQNRLLSFRKASGAVWNFISSGMAATLSATLLTLPLTIFYFGILSLAAPLVNLLVLWAVTGVFTLGLCSCVLGGLGAAVAWIVSILCRYILGVCTITASVPFAAAYPQNVPLMVWGVLLYLLAAAVLTFDRFPVRWSLCVMTLGFVACVMTSHWGFVSHPWRLTALDVGQGQSLVLQIGDYTALIDCGGSAPQKAGEQAARFFHSAGITHIDALIVTHFDADHVGGVEQFLSRVETDMVFLPLGENETVQTLRGYDTKLCTVADLTQVELPEGSLTIYPPILKENDNNSGICVLATAAEYDILITGDMDQNAERCLLSIWELPDVELLIAGHHGAATSTSQQLLDTVRPETVLISVGSGNAYGHPHQETLDRIRSVGAQIWRTDVDGTICIHP